MNVRIFFAAVAASALIAGCGNEEFGDLKEELKDLTKDMRGKVAPLPVVKPYEPVPYEAEALADPFGPTKIEIATRASGAAGNSKLKPDENRPKEPLEAFPLESLRMVGTLTQNKETFALVRADASLYRVKKGNYLGQNFGLITAINDGEIKMRELVQDGAGDWAERETSLQMQESGR